MKLHSKPSTDEVNATMTEATPPLDARLGEELRPRLNALVEIAELLKMKSGSDENVQRILTVARDLLDKVERELPEPASSDAGDDARLTNANAGCDVLYIEDNPINFGAVKLLLGNQRALKVSPAKCGETGVALAETRAPRLILLDLNLPDMHGSEVISRLQKNPLTAHVPVVVLSADATPSQIERLLVLGARNYLTKPFDVQPFLAVIDEVLKENTAPRTT